MCKVTYKCVRVTIVAVKKQKVLTYSERVFVAVVIHYVLRMRRNIGLLSFVTYLGLRYF